MFNYKDNLSPLKSQGFSEEAVLDLAGSGLELKTVLRMGVLPLTPENFKRYVHRSLVEKATRSPIALDGYVIPYPHVTPSFGRVKVLKWNKGSVYYQERKGELPKYLQPSSSNMERVVHGYVLEDSRKLLKSPKSVYVITEGEKKTAKLQQELDRLSTDYRKFVALGLGGVWNWSEEVFKELGASFDNRKVFLCFDADGVYNVNVAKAEITLYGFLLKEGAKEVRSLIWNVEEGKGVDDYLVRKEEEGRSPEKVLEELMEKAVSPLRKYKDTLSLESVLKCLAENLEELPYFLLDEIKKLYGENKRKVKKLFSQLVSERRKRLEEKLKAEEEEKLLEVYKKLFGIEFIPKIPKGFEKWEGQLLYKGESICEFFVVKELRENVDEMDGGYVVTLSFVSGKEFEVEHSVLSSHKTLCRFFNKKGILVSESEAKKIQDYVAKFVRLNKKSVQKDPYSSRIGWGKVEGEEVYVHPETTTMEVYVSPDIKEKLQKEGSKEKELETVREIFKKFPHAGLVYVMGVTTSVLYPLLKRDYNLVVMLQGESGSGKTSAIKGAVSFYAHPELKRSFKFTEGGFEAFVSRLKDFPIHLEEIRDIDRNPSKRVEKFVDFVYGFVGEDGKVRMNIDLSLRKTEKYRGVIFTSSEVGIEEILLQLSDSYRDGLKRRLLVVPVEKEKFGGEELAKLVEVLHENHGHLLPVFLEHFKENRERIEEAFKERVADFREGYSRLDAKLVRFLSAVSVVMEELEKLFGLDVSPLWTALEEVGSFNEEVYSGEENLKEKVESLVKGLNRETLVEEENALGQVTKTLKEYRGEFLVYRRVQREGDRIVEEKNYLTPKGLLKLSELLGVGRNVLVKKLIELGMMEKDPSQQRLCRRELKTVLYESTRMWLYPLNLSLSEAPEEVEVAVEL